MPYGSGDDVMGGAAQQMASGGTTVRHADGGPGKCYSVSRYGCKREWSREG
jgi:hypothetical protein